MELAISQEDEAKTPLDHNLQAFFGELRQFSSTKAVLSSPLYATLRREIESVLSAVWQEDLSQVYPDERSVSRQSIRVAAWNIERGSRLPGIIHALKNHPRFKGSDVLLLTELDYGMARTGNQFIAREIALALGLNYAFAPCYLALTKGSGGETLAGGENTLALHGNALFSRYALLSPHALALPNGKDKMRGEEKRLGSQRAVIADVAHPAGMVRMVCLHLDAHSTQRHRKEQMQLVLDHLDTLTPELPVLIGGDWNTSTYNSRRALYSIAGYARRVLMGVRNVLEKHYPYPDRWFERGLFKQLDRRGYDYRSLNKAGACTLHYDIANMATNENMADWIPKWCFWFMNWALKDFGGRCSMKLDWFAGRQLTAGDEPPGVIAGLQDSNGPLSDHDPIVVTVKPVKTC